RRSSDLEPQHGVVLAEEAVRQPAAEQREEIHADHEGVEHVLRHRLAFAALGQIAQQHRTDQERHQDVAHPVEAEALAGLVADDVLDLAGHPARCGRSWRGAVVHARAVRASKLRRLADPAVARACGRYPAVPTIDTWPEMAGLASCQHLHPRHPPMKQFLSAALLAALAAALPAIAQSPLTTVAERSGFVKTGRYDETLALCAGFARRHPDAVRCLEFGTTPEGRPMMALAVSRSGALTPQAARERGIPVVLMQGGIHAGEIDGKDAGFLALGQVLAGEAAPGALDQLVWLFVPVFSVDGHERFGAWNRPNQRGPEEMGWRTTAQNYNLNRDYAKADS